MWLRFWSCFSFRDRVASPDRARSGGHRIFDRGVMVGAEGAAFKQAKYDAAVVGDDADDQPSGSCVATSGTSSSRRQVDELARSAEKMLAITPNWQAAGVPSPGWRSL